MVRTDEVLRLLLVEESLTDADHTITQLRQSGHAVRASRYDSLEEIEKSLSTNTWDLVLCRDNLKSVTVKEVLHLISRLGRDVPCIILASEQERFDELYELEPQDIVLLTDVKRLPFSVDRELNNLFVRRLCRRSERALRESEKRSQLLLQTSRDAVAYVHEGMHIYVNNSYLSLFGYEDEDDVAGLSILDMVVAEDHAKFKTAYRHFSEQLSALPQSVSVTCTKAGGEDFPTIVEFSHAEVEGENCTQLVVRVETPASGALVASEEMVSTFKDVDSLTGLPNRDSFMEELGQAIVKADEENQASGLLYLVIDEFKKVKEQVGLSASDMVLKGVSDVLNKELASNEILARYSDQVFTILIASGDDGYTDERAEVYRKIVDDYISTIDGKMMDLQCSIGISRIAESVSSASVGLDRADRACTQAQNEGGNAIVRYQPALSDLGVGHADKQSESQFWQERVEKVLQDDNFCLHYQPIVSLHGAEQELYDVLIRIKEGDGPLVLAEDFMRHVAESDVMIDIDEWVISHALKALTEHQKEHPKTRFFIKLSQKVLNKGDFIAWLQSSLKENKVDGQSLVFEISETVALNNIDYVKNVIHELKQLGCEFCLEHFGTGLDFSHSLTELDVDYLKINGNFVENMAKDAENQAAVKAIINMSKQAGKATIAEFVSDANSLALLWRLGVDYAMGYYIHEPSSDLDYNFEDDNL